MVTQILFNKECYNLPRSGDECRECDVWLVYIMLTKGRRGREARYPVANVASLFLVELLQVSIFLLPGVVLHGWFMRILLTFGIRKPYWWKKGWNTTVWIWCKLLLDQTRIFQKYTPRVCRIWQLFKLYTRINFRQFFLQIMIKKTLWLRTMNFRLDLFLTARFCSQYKIIYCSCSSCHIISSLTRHTFNLVLMVTNTLWPEHPFRCYYDLCRTAYYFSMTRGVGCRNERRINFFPTQLPTTMRLFRCQASGVRRMLQPSWMRWVTQVIVQ